MKTRLPWNLLPKFSPLAAVLAVFGAAQFNCGATIFTWNVATPTANNWNVSGNWNNPGSPGTADEAVFGATGVSPNNSTINNVVSANTTITSLDYSQNGAAAFHVTQIPSGVILAVTGPFTNGDLYAVGGITPTYLTGGGTLLVGGSPFLSDDFDSGTSSSSMATLDLSGLGTFIYSNSVGLMDLGEDPNASAMNRPGTTFNLAGTSNNITVATINFQTYSGGNGGNANSAINLGAGTNIINVGTFNLASRKNSGTVKFLGATGGFRLRGVNGNIDDTSRATLTIGDVNGKSGTVQPTGKLLLAGAGHPVDIKAGTVLLGRANLAANGTSVEFGTGLITFDAGTFDATTINMAVCSATTASASSGASGAIYVSNNVTAGTSGTLIIGTGGLSLVNATTFNATGNLSIFGGTVNSSGNIIKSTGGANSIGNITNNGGTLIMAANTAIGTAAIPVDNFSLNNASLHLSVNALSAVTNITATSVPVGGTSTITIDAIANYTGGTVTIPLISYATGGDPASGLNLTPVLPAGFAGTLQDDTAKQTIDLQITSGTISIPPVPLTWNGGSSAGNNWSDLNNWDGTNIVAGDTLFFDGNARLNNINDTPAGTVYSNLTFNATAGSFVLNGNAITLAAGGGNITNLSSNLEAVNLPLNYTANTTLSGGTAGLAIGGPLSDTATTGLQTLTLAGNGTLANALAITANGTNTIFMTNSANWTIVDNSSSSPVTISNAGFNITGASTLNFGGPGNSPVLATLVGGQGSDNALGDNNSASTLNINNGTLTMARRLDSVDANLNVSGGTLNVWNQLQWVNGSPANVGSVTVSGGTLNVASSAGTTAGGTFFLASRGTATLTISGGLIECSTLDLSRNAAGTTGPSAGTVDLNGGILQINGAVTNASANFQSGSSPTANFNFNGGTLKANKTGVATFQGSQTTPVIPITTLVQSGGAIIQTASGKQLIILEPLQHDSSLGGTPDGGLTKNGADLLTLTAAATYTGNTKVNAGILALAGSGSLVSPNIIVAGGATFDVSGLSGYILATGQTLTNASSTATLGGNISSGSGTVALSFAVGTPAFNITNGTLTLSTSTIVTVNNTGAPLAAGTYKIISTNSAGFVAGTLPAVTVGGAGTSGGLPGSLTIVDNELYLVVGTAQPIATSIVVTGGMPTIDFSGTAGNTYNVQRSTNLLDWVTVLTTNAPAGGLFFFTDTFSDLGAVPPTAFYRLH